MANVEGGVMGCLQSTYSLLVDKVTPPLSLSHPWSVLQTVSSNYHTEVPLLSEGYKQTCKFQELDINPSPEGKEQ